MHFRKRHIYQILSKRKKIFPVLGLIGPRQVGKTTFLMREWSGKKSRYVTLDKQENLNRAKRAPENFLLSESEDLETLLVIDEAQKAPALFDSIKSLIDERRRVGIFTVSGSVEFSDKAGVRESLAGRMGLCRLYPLTLAELSDQPLRKPWVEGLRKPRWKRTELEIQKWLKRGGMPIFCALHDDGERDIAVRSWLEALCYRDLQQLKGGRFEGDVALGVLRSIARDSKVNVNRLAQNLGVSRGVVGKYLAALESLFLIHSLPSFANRGAAPEYVFFDCAVLRSFLQDDSDALVQEQVFRTLLINEILAQHEYHGASRPGFYGYRRRGGAEIDLVFQNSKRLLGIQISAHSEIKPYALRSLKSFLAANPGAEGVVLAPVTEGFREGGISVVPWTWVG